MVTKVEIPDKGHLPAVSGDGPEYVLISRARETINTLHHTLRTFSKDRARVRHLVSFKDRAYKVKNAEMEEDKVDRTSQVRHGDRPEIEMYLEHRDKVLELKTEIARLWKRIHDTPDTMDNLELVHKLTAKIDRLEEKQLRNMAYMTEILDGLSKEQSRDMAHMVKLTTDAAKIAQAATQHIDKMEIAREATRPPSAEDLMTKLAAKYNVPVEEVTAILSAKNAEVVPDAGK